MGISARALRLVFHLTVLATALSVGEGQLPLGAPLSAYGAEWGSFHEIPQVLLLLKRVPTGKKLIQKAMKVWAVRDLAELSDRFQWSEVSRTDTVLTRHFNPQTGREERERQIRIFLREGQPPLEIALDMAHELVHATARPSFDPYDPELTLGKYILNAIEGEGGELDAVMVECEIGLQLSQQLGVPIQRCDPQHSSDRLKVRRDFYQVGHWFSKLTQRLQGETVLFPLSARAPQLYSSTGHAPYPFALLKEFDEITELACNNTRNRMESLNTGQGRLNIRDQIGRFLRRRCQARALN